MRGRVIALKALRRVAVGPIVSLTFENHETVRWQVLEMCRVEGHVTEEKRKEELDVDNEMLPRPGGLAATMFLELPGEALLKTWLPKLVGIEEHVVLRFGGREVRAAFEGGRSKETTTSCVHYVKFALSDVERQMLYFSESPRMSAKMIEVAETFERDYDDADYERKIVDLLRVYYAIHHRSHSINEWDGVAVVDHNGGLLLLDS